MKNSWKYIASLILMIGCKNENSLSFEHDFGKEMIWKDPIEWEWDIQQNAHTYTLHLDLQCAVHYPYDKLPIAWTETDPQGNKVSHEMDIIIRNSDGTFNGDKALDYLNFDIDLSTSHQYQQFGRYRYTLAQKLGPHMEAPFMVEFEITAKENQ